MWLRRGASGLLMRHVLPTRKDSLIEVTVKINSLFCRERAGTPSLLPVGMTSRTVSEIPNLKEAMRLLATIKSPAGAAATARKVASLLEQIDRQRLVALNVPPQRRGATSVSYAVEDSAVGEALTERRPKGSSQPFRCPRPIYAAMITTFADATRPLTTDEILASIERSVGQRPAEHQYRVALRAWSRTTPPLIARSRARYVATDPPSFAERATQFWNRLRVR